MIDIQKRARATKLNEYDIYDIRERYVVYAVDYDPKNPFARTKSNARELAEEYGLTQESIRNIANRKTFKWVK